MGFLILGQQDLSQGKQIKFIYSIFEGSPLQELQFERFLVKWTEITKGFFHPSHGVQITLSRFSSCRAPIFQERGPGTP